MGMKTLKAFCLLALASLCMSTTSSAKWASKEAHDQYMAGVRKLHAEGIKPPEKSPFTGTWTRENGDKVYTFKADGTMTIAKTSGEILEKGTWVHAREKDGKDEFAVYKTGQSVAKVFPYENQIMISWGDLGEMLSRAPKKG